MTTQDQQDKTDRYAQALLLLEQAAVRAVALRLIYTIAALRREATGSMLLARSAATRDQAASALAQQLTAQALPLVGADALLRAVRAEAAKALALATDFALGPGAGYRLPLEAEVNRAMLSAQATAQDRITRAVRLLDAANTPMQVQTALRVADQAVGAIAIGAEYAVNSAANSAPRRIAVLMGQRLVWVAERDACVVCLALSGHVIDPNAGEAFDEEATFGKPGSAPAVWPKGMPLIGPPRHPHCRCVEQVWNGSSNPAVADWPLRLRHEALRSIAKGFSLPNESHQVRIHAAHQILRNGQAGQLPKSVQEFAASAVARGRFRTRDVPVYPPVNRTSVR